MEIQLHSILRTSYRPYLWVFEAVTSSSSSLSLTVAPLTDTKRYVIIFPSSCRLRRERKHTSIIQYRNWFDEADLFARLPSLAPAQLLLARPGEAFRVDREPGRAAALIASAGPLAETARLLLGDLPVSPAPAGKMSTVPLADLPDLCSPAGGWRGERGSPPAKMTDQISGSSACSRGLANLAYHSESSEVCRCGQGVFDCGWLLRFTVSQVPCPQPKCHGKQPCVSHSAEEASYLAPWLPVKCRFSISTTELVWWSVGPAVDGRDIDVIWAL